MCGEKDAILICLTGEMGSPPRVRGKGADLGREQRHEGITPACAGKSHAPRDPSGADRDHPRVCGEKDGINKNGVRFQGSPPRVRGKVSQYAACGVSVRITPACAGKRRKRLLPLGKRKDHPRVCGEKERLEAAHLPVVGSPPRVRGKVANNIEIIGPLGITPACAGKRLKRSQYKAIFSIQHRVIPLVLNKVEAP